MFGQGFSRVAIWRMSRRAGRPGGYCLMHLRTVADLHRDIVNNSMRLPRDVDAVIGIPRSGMLAASLIALTLNRPLGDLEGFAEGRLLSSGSTRRTAALDQDVAALRHVLVVDDSTRTGSAMVEARARLAGLGDRVRITYCVVYGVTDMPAAVDLCLAVVPEPRMFEWNMMHHPLLKTACVDIDGVLCHDPTEDENDDGPAYLTFLENARPLNLPTQRLGTLVTSRLLKYRPQTEAWLARHGIAYDRLVMLDLPDAETRRRSQAHGGFKGEYYRDSDSWLFIESELPQARRIAEISGKPVLCMDGPVVCYPGAASPVAVMQRIRKPHLVKRIVRRTVGDVRYRKLKESLRGVRRRPTPPNGGVPL